MNERTDSSRREASRLGTWIRAVVLAAMLAGLLSGIVATAVAPIGAAAQTADVDVRIPDLGISCDGTVSFTAFVEHGHEFVEVVAYIDVYDGDPYGGGAYVDSALIELYDGTNPYADLFAGAPFADAPWVAVAWYATVFDGDTGEVIGEDEGEVLAQGPTDCRDEPDVIDQLIAVLIAILEEILAG